MPATIEEINRLFESAMKSTSPARSVDRQLECWDKLKTLIPTFPIDLNDPDKIIVPGFDDSLYDWLPSLELDLGQLALENPQYVPKYLAYLEDVIANVVVEDHRLNFHRSYAEALALAGRLPEAEAVLARLLLEAPGDAWTWLTWADLYLGLTPPNVGRAREILVQAKSQGNLDEEGILDDRLAEIDAAPAPSAVSQKVGRNNPCPCGSGKKYKKCCGA